MQVFTLNTALSSLESFNNDPHPFDWYFESLFTKIRVNDKYKIQSLTKLSTPFTFFTATFQAAALVALA